MGTYINGLAHRYYYFNLCFACYYISELRNGADQYTGLFLSPVVSISVDFMSSISIECCKQTI